MKPGNFKKLVHQLALSCLIIISYSESWAGKINKESEIDQNKSQITRTLPTISIEIKNKKWFSTIQKEGEDLVMYSPPQEKDIDSLVDLMENKEVQKTLNGGPFSWSKNDCMNSVRKEISRNTPLGFFIAKKLDDTFVGLFCFEESTYFYYAVCPKIQGNGFGSKIMRNCVDYYFSKEIEDIGEGSNRINANVLPKNIGSRKVIEKAGFEKISDSTFVHYTLNRKFYLEKLKEDTKIVSKEKFILSKKDLSNQIFDIYEYSIDFSKSSENEILIFQMGFPLMKNLSSLALKKLTKESLKTIEETLSAPSSVKELTITIDQDKVITVDPEIIKLLLKNSNKMPKLELVVFLENYLGDDECSQLMNVFPNLKEVKSLNTF